MKNDPEYISSVTLMILSEDLNPDEITDRLTLTPSQAWRRGDHKTVSGANGTKVKLKTKHRWGGWKRFLGAAQEKLPLESQIDFWCRKLKGHTAALADFKSKGWYCVLDLFVTTDGTASIIFSTELQRRVAELGLDLQISIFAASGESAGDAKKSQSIRSGANQKSTDKYRLLRRNSL